MMKKILKKDKQQIIELFKKGKIIIMLTDTVYGIMALANKENETKINKLKQSNLNKKLSIIFPSKKELLKYITDLNLEKKELINKKLPGKYTFIVNLDNFSNFDRQDFGIRVTSNNYLQDIIAKVGPIIATSCNISGKNVCSSTKEIEKEFKNADVILVVDKNADNKASTIIDLTSDIKIIRS